MSGDELARALRDYMGNMKLMTSGERELFTNCADLLESLKAKLQQAQEYVNELQGKCAERSAEKDLWCNKYHQAEERASALAIALQFYARREHWMALGSEPNLPRTSLVGAQSDDMNGYVVAEKTLERIK